MDLLADYDTLMLFTHEITEETAFFEVKLTSLAAFNQPLSLSPCLETIFSDMQAKINSLSEENAELRKKDESERFERSQRGAEQQSALREVEELKRTCERLAESEGRLQSGGTGGTAQPEGRFPPKEKPAPIPVSTGLPLNGSQGRILGQSTEGPRLLVQEITKPVPLRPEIRILRQESQKEEAKTPSVKTTDLSQPLRQPREKPAVPEVAPLPLPTLPLAKRESAVNLPESPKQVVVPKLNPPTFDPAHSADSSPAASQVFTLSQIPSTESRSSQSADKPDSISPVDLGIFYIRDALGMKHILEYSPVFTVENIKYKLATLCSKCSPFNTNLWRTDIRSRTIK